MMTEMEEPSNVEEKKEATKTTENWRTRTAAALRRRRLFLEAQQEARRIQAARTKELEQKQKKESRLSRGVQSVGTVLQKINIGKWIDDLEKDQELADRLDVINRENREEAARLEICRQAEEACMKAIKDHLASFLQEHPHGSYEDWIRDLHPDNVSEQGQIDPRFFVSDSDHRILWKESHTGKEENDLVDEDLSETLPNDSSLRD